jgi:hypothetical protein
MMDKHECSFWQRGNGDVVRNRRSVIDNELEAM